MEVIDFNFEKHGEVIGKWFEHYKWPSLIKPLIPPNSVVVVKNGQLISACFLYRTDGPAAWLEWTVASPDYREDDRGDAIKLAVSTLVDRAKSLGHLFVLTAYVNESLEKKYLECGMKVTDTNMKHGIFNFYGG